MNFRLLKMLNRSYRSPAPVTYLSTNLSPDLPTSYLSTYPQYPASWQVQVQVFKVYVA